MWLITKARLRSMGRRVVTSDEYLQDIALDGKLVRESGITFDIIPISCFILLLYYSFFFSFIVLCCERSRIDGRSDR